MTLILYSSEIPSLLEQIGNQVKQSAQAEMQRGINKQVQQANQQLNSATKQAQQAVANKMAGNQEAQTAQQQPDAQTPQEPQVAQPGGRVVSEESKAAQQRLRDILAGKKGQVPGTETAPKITITPGNRASLNSQIPSKYKRLQKAKKSGDTPSNK